MHQIQPADHRIFLSRNENDPALPAAIERVGQAASASGTSNVVLHFLGEFLSPTESDVAVASWGARYLGAGAYPIFVASDGDLIARLRLRFDLWSQDESFTARMYRCASGVLGQRVRFILGEERTRSAAPDLTGQAPLTADEIVQLDALPPDELASRLAAGDSDADWRDFQSALLTDGYFRTLMTQNHELVQPG